MSTTRADRLKEQRRQEAAIRKASAAASSATKPTPPEYDMTEDVAAYEERCARQTDSTVEQLRAEQIAERFSNQKDMLGEWIAACEEQGLSRDHVRRLLCRGLTCEWLTEDEAL